MHRLVPAAVALTVLAAGYLGYTSLAADTDAPGPAIGTTSRPTAYDPAGTYTVADAQIATVTTQRLLWLPPGSDQPEPDAAQACDWDNREQTVYRCTLRTNLTFADGHPVTTTDVVNSLSRITTIDDDDGPASLYSGIKRIRADGNRDIVLTLAAPDATLPLRLAHASASILPSRLYPRDQLRKAQRIDGSGPYVLEHVRADVATFTANGRYRGPIKRANSRFTIHYFTSAKQLLAALRSGKIHVTDESLQPDQVATLDSDILAGAANGLELQHASSGSIRMLAVHTTRGPLKHRAVRQAIAQLVDRKELAGKVYHATVEPLYAPIPTGTLGHTTSFYDRYGGRPDPAAARRLLAEAGLPTPIDLTLTSSPEHYGPAHVRELELLAEQLQTGRLFKVKTKAVAWKDYSDILGIGAYQLAYLGWAADFPNGETYLAPFIGANNVLGNGYTNAGAERRLAAGRRSLNVTGNLADWSRIQDDFARDVPLLPLTQATSTIARRESLLGAADGYDPITALMAPWTLRVGSEQ